jgi:replicative DNA helicase
MNYGELLLSRVIDNNDVGALKRFGIESEHLVGADRKALEYITEYAEHNRGQAPSYATIAGEVEGFNYIPDVSDSFTWLAEQVKANAAKRQLADYINGDFSAKYSSERDGNKLLDDLISDIQSIKIRTSVRNDVGTDVKKSGDQFLTEYRARKAGESFKIWKSAFPTINKEIGGYLSGNMYTWYGRSGRGKSVFTLIEAIESAMQGANVLIWALEMPKFEVLSRIFSMVSARDGVTTATIDGVDYEAGFENIALLMGRLSEEFEAGLETFLTYMHELIPGNITIRAVDDDDFYTRGVKQLEADIIATKADVVIVDPFYYLDYEANTSKTTGGDAANTSKKMRHLAGYTKTTIHVITQADEDSGDKNEEVRELKAPKRSEILKTKAVLHDAVSTFGIDSADGLGAIELGKGRNGGEGTLVEVLYMPNFGIVREMPSGEAVANQFTEVF